MDTTEARIIIKHNLDTTSLENLATDLATKWGYNVEFGEYQNQDGNHEFRHIGTAKATDQNITISLFDTTADSHAQHDYVIDFGEEAKVIFNDIMMLLPPWEEEYENILQRFKDNEMNEDTYYNAVFDEFRKIGAEKVYFISNDYNIELQLDSNSTFSNYIESIKTKIPFFEVKLI